MAPKSKTSVKMETPVETPVIETPVETPVMETSTKKTNKKGGSKKVATVEAAPVVPVEVAPAPVPAPVPVQATVNKSPVKKASGKKNQAVVSNLPTEQIAEPKNKVNKVNKVKKVKSNDEKVVQKEDEVVEEEEGDSKTRSFKVKLPSDEGFSGRFTGLTPYQAANKALSKYFRCAENNEGDVNITFSIKESTRGSKRHEYNYKGSRLKLEKPITYTIKSLSGEERVITKQYKNQLIKIKKNVVKQAAAVV